MLTRVKDLDQQILSNVPDKQLLKVCSINKSLWYHVCDDNFLRRRLSKYPEIEKYKREESWKRFFLNAIKTMSIMKKRYNFEYTEGNFRMQNILLQLHKGNVNDLLFDACIEGQFSLVVFILKKKIRQDILNDALNLASVNGRLRIVKYLFENESSIHSKLDKALRSACLNGHLEVVKYLVECGSDIHSKDDYALKAATREGHLHIVEYLLKF